MSEKVMTYEVLFEILRIEKNREELQSLDKDFFNQVLNYLCDKQKSYENKQGETLLFERDDKERARLELENVRKILKDIYDRREKKIIRMALNKSRSGISLVNISAMLPSEQALFSKINSQLGDFRERVLHKIVSGELPCGDDLNCQLPEQDTPKPPSNTYSPETASENHNFKESDNPDQTKELKTPSFLSETGDSRLKVRFIENIDEIIGPDLQIYGPFEIGAEAALPKELAAALIDKNQAEGL